MTNPVWINELTQGAVFSPDRRHRYSLWRRWQENCPLSEMVGFVGLNPSTADETLNDPTVTRCINFARDWGFSGMVMLNAFAFRATDPKVMKGVTDPVGPENDAALRYFARELGSLICCWGSHGGHHNRSAVLKPLLLRDARTAIFHLGLTQGGQPRHPLYLRADTPRIRWMGSVSGVISGDGQDQFAGGRDSLRPVPG